ncbi:MAG: MgtC/SapB family protein [Bacteroidales bacterium]|nr:MgtC/SapB family protein [Bacteroidales bacterium]
MDWINQIIASNQITLETTAFRIFLSVIIGGLIGFERQRSKHSAGFRTFTLISVGSTVMMLVSIYLPQEFWGVYNSDPTRLAGQVVSGIGFLGAGAIIQSKGAIRGMTTAASIWIVSALGLAVGAGMYSVALMGMIATLFVLINLAKFERRVMVEWTAKSLTIVVDGLDFRRDPIETILKKYGLSIHDFFVDQEISQNKTHLHFSIYVKLGTDYEQLFAELRRIPSVSIVKLWS